MTNRPGVPMGVKRDDVAARLAADVGLAESANWRGTGKHHVVLGSCRPFVPWTVIQKPRAESLGAIDLIGDSRRGWRRKCRQGRRRGRGGGGSAEDAASTQGNCEDAGRQPD